MTTLNEIIGDKIMEFTKAKEIIIKINTITSYGTENERDPDDVKITTCLRTYYAKFEKKELRGDLKFEHDLVKGILRMDSLDKLLSIKNYDVEKDLYEFRIMVNYPFITNYLSFERIC